MRKVIGTTVFLVGIGITAPLGAQTPQPPTPAPAAKTPRIWIALNGATQTGTQDFGLSTTSTLYDEQATLKTTQSVKGGATAEISALVRVWRDFSLGAAYSGLNSAQGGSITASVPHPLAYDRPRTAAAQIDSLQHRERAVHIFAAWSRRLGDRMDVTVSGGSTIFQVKQDFITGMTISETGGAYASVDVDAVNKVTINENAPGFNIGGDFTYMITRFLGAGAFVRYSAGKLDVKAGDQTINLNVGGFQIGGGVRTRLW